MRLSLAFVSLVTATALACGGDPTSTGTDAGPDAPDGGDGLTTVLTLPANPRGDVDLLVVVDNSASMGEEQTSLAANLPVLINELSQGGLPSVHIGVVSSDVGTDGVVVPSCSTAARPQGDDGMLRTNACPSLTGEFISDVELPDGSRLRNYAGDLSTLFGCMVRLGTTGCGFEQHLESMKRALSPGRNAGFLRPDALLAVLIVADEDDCSTLPGGAMFGDPTGGVGSPLGPRTSFRCFEFGVQCDNDPNPRAFGPRTGCVPRPGSQYMPTPQPYIDFLRGLKADPRDLVVGGVIGNVTDDGAAVVVPDPDDATRPSLAAACQSANGIAAPGIRLQAFLDAFAFRTVGTICNDNLADTLREFAAQIKSAIGDPCVHATLADTDPDQPGVQPRCVVTDTLDSVTTVIPACTGSDVPCWQFVDDPFRCAADPDHRLFEVVRGGASVPLGTISTLRCAIAP